MFGRARLLGALCLGALVASACGEPGQGSARRPPLVTSTDRGGAPPIAQARWIFHPTTRTEAKARLELGGQRELAVGDGGERWLEGVGEVADVAPFVAPEALIDLGRSGDRYAFVGASGLVYLAEEPLGPFVDVRRPPRPFVSAASYAGVLAGVEPSGELWIGAEWGARWEAAEVQGARFVEVALGARGAGLALAVPEAWWTSADGGRSWRPADLSPLGASRISRDAAGELFVEGLFRRARYEEGRWTEPAAARPGGAQPSPAAPLGPSPDAARVQEGGAVLDDAGYFGLELMDEPGEQVWNVLSGPLGARLQERRAEGLPSTQCRDVRVARSKAHVAVLCKSKEGGHTSALLRLYLSEDEGVTFQRKKLSLRGEWSELRLAVGPRGTVMLSGICPPHRMELGCAPRGAYRLLEGMKELEPLALPGLGRVDALAVGPQERLYVVGARDKDQRLSLYASLDDGRSFHIRDLEVGDGGAGDRRHGSRRFVPRLTIDEDGALAVVVRTTSGWVHVALDPEGYVLSRGAPPAPARSVAAVGLKALALDPARPSLWESLDGGSSWEVVPLPRPLCPIGAPRGSGDNACEVEMSCAPAGCLLGASLSRLGWDAEEQATDIGDPRAFPSEAAAPGAPKTPIACVLGGEPWQALEGVSGVPGAPDAVAGRTTWFAVASDFETGAVWALHAHEGERSVRRQQLFGPLAEPTRHALAVVDQVEGSAALRYRIPHSSRGETEISAVEVAWDNRFHDLVGRATIAGTFAPRSGDYRSHAPRTLLAQPALLSIAGRGVHVRLHASPQDQQPTYYTEGPTVEALPAVPWPASREARRTEMVRAGARSLPIAFHGSGPWVAWAHPSEDAAGAGARGGWSWGASLLGLPRSPVGGLGQSVSITYSGLTPAIAVVEASPGGRWWHAYTLPFRWASVPFGEPEPAPLLADLPDPPTPCGAAERQSSPRVVAPAFPGEPYTILVTDAVDPPELLTTKRAVLHGTPDRPCLAAFEASGPSPRGQRASRSTSTTSGRDTTSERFFALLPAADLGHAWLFREVSGAHWERTVHARPMSCRFDASTVIPPELSGVGAAP